MKRNTKFLLLFLAAVMLFSAVSAVVSSITLSEIRTATNDTVTQIIANVCEKHPDINEDDIIKILDNKSDTTKTKELLKRYGITDEDWITHRNESNYVFAVTASAAGCAVAGIAFGVIFVIYMRKKKRETEKLASYLSQINSGNYELTIDENSEDESSILKNEIFKTTVMLRENAENAQKGKESLKESLSDISHQLKTPLTSVMIMVDNLRDDENMPEDIRREFLSDIRRSSGNISFLVQSLLTLSKLDADSIELKSKPENIADIFDDCIQNTAILAEIRGVNVTADCENVMLNCDRKWLGEALSNIVKNCIEHTPGGGSVTLKAEQNKLYTKLTIEDTGCGIAPEDFPHIFERFYKGKNSDKGSIGIGLAMSKAIIEKAGGFITADSKMDKGSRFTIKFFGLNH